MPKDKKSGGKSGGKKGFSGLPTPPSVDAKDHVRPGVKSK